MLIAAAGAAVVGALLGRAADCAAVTSRRAPSPAPLPAAPLSAGAPGSAAPPLPVAAPPPADAPAAVGAPPARLGDRPHWSARAVGAPLPELVGALVAVAVVLRLGADAALPAWLWFVAVGLQLAIIDLREQLLPNRVLVPGVVVAVVLLAGAAAVDDGWTQLRRAVLAGLVCFVVLLVMALVSPAGMGMGDVKLAGFLGLYLGWLGWPVVLVGFFLGFLVQACVALVLLAARRVGRRAELPFGPALLAGTLGALLLTGGWAGLPG